MNKVALITGAGRGLGKTIALTLAKANYNIVVCYNNSKNGATEVVNKIKQLNTVDAMAIKCNIENELEIKQMITNITKKFGTIDVLINNAAVCIDCLFNEKTAENFEKTLKTNVVGTFLVSKYVGEVMKKNKYGKIVNLASTNGINTYYPMCVDYDASKSAIISLTHNLAMQFAPYVNVNAIAPGFIATESEIGQMDDEFIKLETEKIFVKRVGTEQDVANLIEFLVSDNASFVNNEVIRIDGGMYGTY